MLLPEINFVILRRYTFTDDTANIQRVIWSLKKDDKEVTKEKYGQREWKENTRPNQSFERRRSGT